VKEPQEGQLWIAADGYRGYHLIRIAAKPTEQKALMETWEPWGSKWGRASSRYKNCLVFLIEQPDADPVKIHARIMSAKAQRDQRQVAADNAFKAAVEKIAAAQS
jgi:hypothetical protein